MNDEIATRYIQTALRTIEIIRGLQAGKRQAEVMRETGADRGLVHYYANALGLTKQK